MEIPRKRRRNRNILTGMVIVILCLAALIYLFEIPTGELLSFFLSTVLFVLAVILLAVLATVLLKGVGRLGAKLRRRHSGDGDSRE